MATGKRTKERPPSHREFEQPGKSKTSVANPKNYHTDFSDFQDEGHIGTSENTKSSQSADFMLKEYERLYLLKMDETKQSEQRVTFFLTIASAAIGSLVLLAQTSSFAPDKILVLARVTLIVLLLFGITILNRMNARFVQLRTFDQLMSEIRVYFRTSYPELAAYFEKHDKLFQPSNYRFNVTKHVLRRFRGTLNDLVILSNALICGALGYIHFYDRGYRGDLIVGLTVAVIIGAIAFFYIHYYYFIRRLPPFG
jgi:hypothetical protein